MTEPTTNQEETVDEVDATDETAASEGAADAGARVGASGDEPRNGNSADGDDPTGAADGDGKAEADRAAVAEGSGDVLEAELAALRDEFESLNDRHLRLVAEFNNFRRRSEQERMSAWARAQADLVGDLLDVLDDLQRVANLDLSNASVEGIMEGIDLVERKFVRQLEEAGVEVIEPAGQAFDPERMEAMMRVPSEDEEQVDTVAQVFQKGYSLKGTLVRPARVSVYTEG